MTFITFGGISGVYGIIGINLINATMSGPNDRTLIAHKLRQ